MRNKQIVAAALSALVAAWTVPSLAAAQPLPIGYVGDEFMRGLLAAMTVVGLIGTLILTAALIALAFRSNRPLRPLT